MLIFTSPFHLDLAPSGDAEHMEHGFMQSADWLAVQDWFLAMLAMIHPSSYVTASFSSGSAWRLLYLQRKR